MRVLLKGLRLLVVAAIVPGILSAEIQPAPARGNHIVSGIVVNAVTGDPVRRALVTLNERSMLTDGEGRFEFRNLPNPQGYVINVNKPGFFDERDLSQGQAYETETASAGASPHRMIVKLVPEGVLTGQVESESGPVESVLVNAISSRIGEGMRRWELQGGATTDEDGVFRIASLRPGTYYLSIKPSMSQFTLPSGNPPRPHGYSQSFYPGVPDLGAASPIEVAAGQEVHADFKLKLSPLYHISGTVSGVDLAGPVVTQVQVASGDPFDVSGIYDEDPLRFFVQAPAGSFVIEARAHSQSGQMMAADLPMEVSGDVKGVSLALLPVSPIVVTFHQTLATHVGTDQTAFRQRIPLVHGSDNALAGVTLFNATPMVNSPQYYGSPRKDAPNSGMILQDVEPGAYRVEVQSIGGWYVASAMCGNSDLLQGLLTVRPGSPSPPLEVELRDDGGMLQASVTSEILSTASSKAWVLVVPSGSPQEARTARAQNQPAIFADLAPGEYSVLAFDSIDGLEYKDPEVLAEFMGRATQVTVTPEQIVETKVELIQRTKP